MKRTNIAKGCHICLHLTDYPQTVCPFCGKDHECFVLDEAKLEEEVALGTMTKREARRIRQLNKEEDRGIPGQLSLPEGRWM